MFRKPQTVLINLLIVALQGVLVLLFVLWKVPQVLFQGNWRLPRLRLRLAALPRWSQPIVAGLSIALLGLAVTSLLQLPKAEAPLPRYRIGDLQIPTESVHYVGNDTLFREALVHMGERLQMEPAWILAVMYHESRLNPAAVNFRGSGATGLIQFMVPALKDLNRRLGTRYYLSDLRAMSAIAQLPLVEAYFAMIQERYGPINSLTDAYLAVLYPKAIGQAPGHVLFARPSRRYLQNSGLDQNRDGKVSVGDITQRLYRMFPDLAEAEQGRLTLALPGE